MIRILWAWWFWITNRNDEVAQQRLKICAGCSQMKWGVCKMCGCPLQTKTRLLDEVCPLNKW